MSALTSSASACARAMGAVLSAPLLMTPCGSIVPTVTSTMSTRAGTMLLNCIQLRSFMSRVGSLSCCAQRHERPQEHDRKRQGSHARHHRRTRRCKRPAPRVSFGGAHRDGAARARADHAAHGRGGLRQRPRARRGARRRAPARGLAGQGAGRARLLRRPRAHPRRSRSPPVGRPAHDLRGSTSASRASSAASSSTAAPATTASPRSATASSSSRKGAASPPRRRAPASTGRWRSPSASP